MSNFKPYNEGDKVTINGKDVLFDNVFFEFAPSMSFYGTYGNDNYRDFFSSDAMNYRQKLFKDRRAQYLEHRRALGLLTSNIEGRGYDQPTPEDLDLLECLEQECEAELDDFTLNYLLCSESQLESKISESASFGGNYNNILPVVQTDSLESNSVQQQLCLLQELRKRYENTYASDIPAGWTVPHLSQNVSKVVEHVLKFEINNKALISSSSDTAEADNDIRDITAVNDGSDSKKHFNKVVLKKPLAMLMDPDKLPVVANITPNDFAMFMNDSTTIRDLSLQRKLMILNASNNIKRAAAMCTIYKDASYDLYGSATLLRKTVDITKNKYWDFFVNSYTKYGNDSREQQINCETGKSRPKKSVYFVTVTRPQISHESILATSTAEIFKDVSPVSNALPAATQPSKRAPSSMSNKRSGSAASNNQNEKTPKESLFVPAEADNISSKTNEENELLAELKESINEIYNVSSLPIIRNNPSIIKYVKKEELMKKNTVQFN